MGPPFSKIEGAQKILPAERDDRLAAISRSHIVIAAMWCGVRVMQVGEDGRVSQFMKVKLSVSASSVRETGLREVRWVQPNCDLTPNHVLNHDPDLYTYASSRVLCIVVPRKRYDAVSPCMDKTNLNLPLPNTTSG